jgi:hypothetical protein
VVISGLDPAIRTFLELRRRPRLAGSSPAMTTPGTEASVPTSAFPVRDIGDDA